MHLGKLLIAGLILLAGATYAFWYRTETSSMPVENSTPVATPVVSSAQHPSVLIVPHHDLVAGNRQRFFAEVVKTGVNPKTVILVSPNHYESGRGIFQATAQEWNTDAGVLRPPTALLEKAREWGVTLEPASFNNEHGIRTILRDIATSFPEAELLPLLASTRANKDQVVRLTTELEKHCGECLLIASVDFSHYQPAILAGLHDQLSIRALQKRDLAVLEKQVEVDSPQSLMMAAHFAELRQTPHFALKDHTNSGDLVDDLDGETTTHLFAWYEAGEPATPTASLSFIIGGDVMLDRSVADLYFFNNGGDFPKVVERFSERTFWGTDLSLLNLEGPISAKPVENNTTSTNLVFNFPPESLKVLQTLKVNTVSLANNHSANAGSAGLANTRAVLTQANIAHFGGPSDSEVSKTTTIQGEGIRLHMVGVHATTSSPDVTSLISSFKKSPEDRVLVFPHWGNEYLITHTSSQSKLAKAWIDAGADLVVGAHPHVVEDSEVYKGVPIIYSLGNFIFDQWFSRETERGMVLGGEFTNEGLRLFGLPIGLHKAQPYLLKGSEKKERLERIYKPLQEYRRQTDLGEELYFTKLKHTLEESR